MRNLAFKFHETLIGVSTIFQITNKRIPSPFNYLSDAKGAIQITVRYVHFGFGSDEVRSARFRTPRAARGTGVKGDGTTALGRHRQAQAQGNRIGLPPSSARAFATRHPAEKVT